MSFFIRVQIARFLRTLSRYSRSQKSLYTSPTDIIYDKIIVNNNYIKYSGFSASLPYCKKIFPEIWQQFDHLFKEIFCQKIDSPVYDFAIKIRLYKISL